MKLNFHIFKNIAVVITTAIFFYACSSKSKNKNTINFNEVAQGVGVEVTIKHTDSGRLTSILKAPILKDYNHLEFPYAEFPKGMKLIILDKEGGKSTIISNYAIQYKKTNLIDLQGNVKVVTADSTILKTTQAYWNQKLNWAYTDNPYTITAKDGSINKGDGFDANKNFTLFKSRTNNGKQILKD